MDTVALTIDHRSSPRDNSRRCAGTRACRAPTHRGACLLWLRPCSTVGQAFSLPPAFQPAPLTIDDRTPAAQTLPPAAPANRAH